MSVEGFEALFVALLFLVPGALFLYTCAAYYSPAMRGEYLRRQFPLELALYYLLASAIIHGILLILGGCITVSIALITSNAQLVKDWYDILDRFPKVSVAEFFFVLLIGVGYLALSLLSAYVGAKRLRRSLLLPTQLWSDEMLKIMTQLAEEKNIFVQVLLDDKGGANAVEGKLGSFQFVGEKGKAFELLLLTERPETPNTTVWLDSSVIQELKVSNSAESWRFIFGIKSDSKKTSA